MAHQLDDEILRRLRDEDPTRPTPPHGDEPDGEREAVRVRLVELQAQDAGSADRSPPPPRRRRAALALAGVVALAGAAIALLTTGGPSGSGPARALAIENTPNGVKLTIEDPGATTEEMNRELADAGIDRVRVVSVPGSPNHAGTWAGTIDLYAACAGAPTKVGYGVRIPYHPENGLPAPGRGFVDLTIPRRGKVAASIGTQSGAGKRAIVSTKANDTETYAPAVLIAIRSRTEADGPEAKQFGAQDLIDFGGVFAPYGEALADGKGRCSELGLEPLPPPTFPPPGDWVTIRISDTPAGAERMTDELRAAGIDGRFRLIPAQPEEVGHWLGFARVPAFGPDASPVGNQIDILTGDPAHPRKPSSKVLALRPEAFTAFPDARWVFYVGRRSSAGEAPQVVTFDGPKNAAATLKNGCKGAGKVSEPSGHKWCSSAPPLQVPQP